MAEKITVGMLINKLSLVIISQKLHSEETKWGQDSEYVDASDPYARRLRELAYAQW